MNSGLSYAPRRPADGPSSSLCLLSLLLVLAPGCSTKSGISGPPAPAPATKAAAVSSGMWLPTPLIISVAAFQDRTGTPELGWVRQGLPDMLVGNLSQEPSLVVVQRERLEAVLREQVLHLSGRVAEDSIVRAGRLTGATVLITGSAMVSRGTLRLETQLVSVETGRVLGAAAAEGAVGEALSVAQRLIADLRTVLPIAPSGGADVVSAHSREFVTAVRGTEGLETLDRQRRLFDALAEHERGLALGSGDPAVRQSIRTRAASSAAELIRAPLAMDERVDRVRLVDELTERLIRSGLRADILPDASESGKTGLPAVRLRVRLQLVPSVVEAVVNAARHNGGRTMPVAHSEGRLRIRLSDDAETNRRFVRAVGVPRRVYLRFWTEQGRTIAVYSELKNWRMDTWIRPVDEEQIEVDGDRVLDGHMALPDLPPDQAGRIASVGVTVDPVPRETASVRLDLLDADRWIGDLADIHQPEWARLRTLPSLIEQQWSPSVTEHAWHVRHLPSNQRSAVVSVVLRSWQPEIVDGPRLLRGSGESTYDEAALGAVRLALSQWLGRVSERDAPQDGDESPGAGPVKLRVQFRLIKDVPAMNLVGPAELAVPLTKPGGVVSVR